ncbi:hypothetical protein [Peribacillus simplex]|nr:hypothetical protein [Peribacillus simplex]WHY58406.1 hypothetical protein QNH43_09170 [Peribacillus simplex]
MKPSAIDADRIAGAIAFPIEQLSDVAIKERIIFLFKMVNNKK